MTRSFVVRTFAVCVASFVPFVVFSCSSSDDTKKAAVAEGCSLNSDCTDPLVCAFRKCHAACATTRDCPDGERCVTSDRPFHVCQLPEEQLCRFNSDCPTGQVCGIDGKCRDQCKTERDCLDGQVCVTGTCADSDEVDAGKLPVTNDASVEASGQPCSYTSECAEPFVCKGGLCTVECRENRDCTDANCVGGRCVRPYCGVDGGGLVDEHGGKFCLYDADCGDTLVCRNDHCECQCVEDKDCGGGAKCTSFRCALP